MAFNRIIELQIIEENIVIKDLRITFQVIKTDTESANTASISIYNLSRESANKIGRKGNNIALRVGYEDEGIKSLFFGTITKATNRKTQTELILELECFDGIQNIQEKTITISYGIGTPAQQVLNDIVRVFGLPLTNTGFTITGQYANGYSFIGKVKDALTEVLGKSGYTWTIQNQQLVVIIQGQTVQRTGLLISPNTGLISSPEFLEDIDEKTVSEDTPRRVKLKCLLFPQLFPGVEMQLESSVINGTFRVEKADSKGDNWEGEFITELEVTQI